MREYTKQSLNDDLDDGDDGGWISRTVCIHEGRAGAPCRPRSAAVGWRRSDDRSDIQTPALNSENIYIYMCDIICEKNI